MKVSERLFSEVKEIWDSYNTHPFVKGIADGSLPVEKFRFYMIQDHLYLMEYAKLFALGIIKSHTESDLRMFASLVTATIDTENAVHQEYLKTLGITREMIDGSKLSFVNESYTNYMLSVGFKDGLAEIATAVLSCSWSYKYIGEYVKAHGNLKNNPYIDWINEYSSKEYSDANDEIINFIDRITKDFSETQIEYLCEIMLNCSRYEALFWDMAFNLEY